MHYFGFPDELGIRRGWRLRDRGGVRLTKMRGGKSGWSPSTSARHKKRGISSPTFGVKTPGNRSRQPFHRQAASCVVPFDSRHGVGRDCRIYERPIRETGWALWVERREARRLDVFPRLFARCGQDVLRELWVAIGRALKSGLRLCFPPSFFVAVD